MVLFFSFTDPDSLLWSIPRQTAARASLPGASRVSWDGARALDVAKGWLFLA
jgi:hypothetical protein